MKLQTKIQLSKVTFSLLALVASIFLLGVLVFVLCVGLQINPFEQATSAFLLTAFVGLIGVIAVLVLFNVATNINLIAEAKIAKLNVESGSRVFTRYGIIFAVTALLLVGMIFVGTYLSKEKYVAIVRAQANEVLQENDDLLEKIGALLTSGKVADFKKLYDIREFLERQRSGLPQLAIIYASDFEGKPALYAIRRSFGGNVEKDIYVPNYFECTKGLDCDYLKRFFSGEDVGILQQSTFRDDNCYIYIPHVGKDARFILLFRRENSYGKIGS
jgi:hypothetical protein